MPVEAKKDGQTFEEEYQEIQAPRERGDVLKPGQNRSANIQPTNTGTGLRGQEKAPKDLRTKTFIAPEEPK